MNSREKLVLSLEKWKGGCEEKKSPFEGGMIGRVERTIRGDDSRSVDVISPVKSSKVPSRFIPQCLRHFPPSKGDFLVAITMLVALFLGAFTTPVLAQSTEAFQDTPPPYRNALSGYSPSADGEILYPQLEEYIRIAIEQNPELQSLRAMVEADRERVREVGVLMDPEITVMYDFNPMMSESQLGQFSVSAMQMFPWFGTLSSRREAQSASADAQNAKVSVRQLEILRDLKITWLDIAEIQEQIRITEENIELVGELEILVDIRYETGNAAQADILRIQMEKERLKNRVANFEDQLKPLKATFNEFLNRTPDSYVETAESISIQDFHLTDEQIHSLVKAENPRFDEIEARSNELDHQMRTAALDGRPSFGVGLEVMGRDFGPMSMFPDARESFIGMATVRVPLYRSRTRSQQQQITERGRALDFERTQTENRLSSEVEEILEELRRAERDMRLLDDELIPRAQQALDILSDEYSVGRARFDELLQMQRELLDLELEKVETTLNQNRAIAKIESLIGGMGQ